MNLKQLELGDQTVALISAYAVKIVGVLAFFLLALVVAGWVRRLVESSMERAQVEPMLVRFAGSMSRWGILVLAALACLGAFGIETTSFAAVIGAAGLAIGLALQGNLANFAAGVMILIFRPFKVGDVVIVGGEKGAVVELDLFTTRLDTPDNRRIIVPNAAVIGGTIENVTFHDTRRVSVDVGTDYTADLDRTREVLEAVFAEVPGGLSDPEPQVVLVSLGDSAIIWQLRLWCATEDFFPVKEALTRQTKIALDTAEIGIPYPQLDLHVQALPAS